MSRDTAKAFYDRSVNDPFDGYITAQDAQAAIDVMYDDLETERGTVGVVSTSYATASGIYTVQHNLGVTPTSISITPSMGLSKAVALAGIVYHVYDASSTQFRVQHSALTGGAITDPQREIAFYWQIAAPPAPTVLPAPGDEPTPLPADE